MRIGTPPAAPQAQVIVLASMTGFVIMPGTPVWFAIDGIPRPSLPHLPHNAAYAAGRDLWIRRPFSHRFGNYQYVVAAINNCWKAGPVEQRTWGAVKALYQ